MDANAILDRLYGLGVIARAEGDTVLLQSSSKVPLDLKDAVREHKPEIMALLARPHQDADGLLVRLRTGHSWLLDQHQRWQSGYSTHTR